MSDTFTIETRYSVKFTTENPVPISKIVESLVAYEKLLRRTPRFIERAYPGIQVIETQVLVDHIESGSLIEDFVIRYVFKGDENYDNFKESVAKIMDDNNALKTLVALGIGAIIGYGIFTYTGQDPEKTHIEAYNNTIINMGGDIQFTADDVQAVLSGMKDKKRLIKQTIHALAPAKTDPNSAVEVNGVEAATIPKEVLTDVPSEYEPPPPREIEEHYDNVKIEVFASDRDKTTSGWAGIVPGIVDARVKFSLQSEVPPSFLHGKTTVKADITVVSRIKEGKSYQPVLVEIRHVYMPQSTTAQTSRSD